MPRWNVIAVVRAYRAGLAGLALVILSASLAEAQVFGPRTTIGKNYQQYSSEQSANAIDPGSCSGESTCSVIFQPIPQQQPLIVQHVSCIATVSTDALTEVSLRTRKGQIFPARLTFLVPVSTVDSTWVVNSPVMHLFKSGERPYVLFRSSAVANFWVVACSISGKLQ